PGPAELAFQILHDLSVAMHRSVELLQVAIDDEGEIVQTLAGGHLDLAGRLRFCHFPISEERPHMGIVGVGNVSITQVAIETSLIDRGQRTQPHDHTWELPEVRHRPRMRIRRQSPAGMRDLLTETIQLVFTQTTFQIGPSVDTRRGVSLKEHLISGVTVSSTTEEMVVADFVEAGS